MHCGYKETVTTFTQHDMLPLRTPAATQHPRQQCAALLVTQTFLLELQRIKY